MLKYDRRGRGSRRNGRLLGTGLIMLVMTGALVAGGSSAASASQLAAAGHPSAHNAVAPQIWPPGSTVVNQGRLTLLPDGAISSPNRKATLALDGLDGDLIVYDELGNTRWRSSIEIGGNRATFQNDCNLVIYNGSRPLWASNTSRVAVCELVIQSDGNVVIYQATPTASWFPIWATGTEH